MLADGEKTLWAVHRPWGEPVIDFPLDIRRLFRSDSPFYRGSFFLCLGAAAMVLGGLLNVVYRLDLWDAGMLQGYVPYSIWTGSLVLMAIGFLWVGSAPDFSRAALVVSLLHLAQVINVLVIVFTNGRSPIAPDSLTMGRLATLLVFVLADRDRIALGPLVVLGSGALMQILKINLRALDVLPAGETIGMMLLDTALVFWLAAGFVLVGLSLLTGEQKWELSKNPGEAMGLAEFNNPEHPWNKNPQEKEPV